MSYSIGIGITNRCNYHCAHCYSRNNNLEEFDLSFEDIKNLCNNLDIKAVNFGTGESILHPQFLKIIDYFHENNIKMGLTTNGLTVKKISDEKLRYFNDIDFSLDFPDKERHNHFRGKDAFENVIDGIKRCKDLRIECSIVSCLMNINFNLMGDLAKIAREMSINLRVNLYKPIHSELFTPTFYQFWEGIKLLFKDSKIISCSEPIVNVALKMSGIEPKSKGIKCGNTSFRVHPDRTIRPCVYWPYGNKTIDNIGEKDFFKCDDMEIIPEECLNCEYLDICHGGCPARRIFRNIKKPDEYCPIINKKNISQINFSRVKYSSHVDLVHSEYLCTIIVKCI